MMKIRVLSIPSRHPFTSKFNRNDLSFVNPDTDLFSSGLCKPDILGKMYDSNAYDVVHIHFSFDRLSLDELEDVLIYFRKLGKPIIWTLHSKDSQRIRDYGNGQYQKLLFQYSDKIISPTQGAKEWCEINFGKHPEEIEIIPLGFMADPREVIRLQETTQKDRKLFTMLIGEFRQNKEFLQSIVNFLQCTELADFRLQLIFKPIPLLDQENRIRSELAFFYTIIQNNRIEILSKPEISNDEIVVAFLRSHAIIVSSKWGTHSGQIELAKDCGCHVVASDVGFYKEQMQNICFYKFNEVDHLDTAKGYTFALIEAAKRTPVAPLGVCRLDELNDAVYRHIQVYTALLNKKDSLRK